MASGNTPRQRRDVWKITALDPWHPTLLWYAKAVRAMQGRKSTDPTGWRYQAAIHDYTLGVTPAQPPRDTLPSDSEQKRFWKRCQHGSWFFLPWHRMYLLEFERIVAAAVIGLGGPADWSLPYWNYSDTTNPKARELPPAFIQPTLQDGSPNPLRIDERDYTGAGNVGLSAEDVELSCLQEGIFAGVGVGASGGFGGQITGFSHNGGGPGGLERTPHASVHGAVGGFMGRFDTAALDPVFWLHHANIDRLWEVWRQRSPATHTDPADQSWEDATGIAFEFHDDSGAITKWTPRHVTDTAVPPLTYTYEDVSDPLAPAGAPVGSGVTLAVERSFGSKRMVSTVGEVVGATNAPLDMLPGITTTEVPLRRPTGPARAAGVLEGAAPTQRIFLNLENITGRGDPTNYSVYLNLPAGADPGLNQDCFAGSMPTFGVAEASGVQDPHGGSGLTHVLDITDVAARLAARGAWDIGALRVSFLPRKPLKAGAQVSVGRVSVYYRSG